MDRDEKSAVQLVNKQSQNTCLLLQLLSEWSTIFNTPALYQAMKYILNSKASILHALTMVKLLWFFSEFDPYENYSLFFLVSVISSEWAMLNLQKNWDIQNIQGKNNAILGI